MKLLALFLSSIIFITSGKAQWDTYVYFDDTISTSNIFIDTVSNSNNIWQIATPQKSVFNAAITPPNVIMTDSVNSYPSNDTSSFIVYHESGLGISSNQHAGLGCNYFVNSDTLSDFGLIELSIDNGISWLNISDNSALGWSTVFPSLTGNSDGWKSLDVNFIDLIPFGLVIGDTIQIKFTFISDSIQNNSDGLMFDNIWVYEYFSNINENNSSNIKSYVYPNPSVNRVNIQIEGYPAKEHLIKVFDSSGKIIDSFQMEKEIEIDIKHYKSGLYHYVISNDYNLSRGSFIKI